MARWKSVSTFSLAGVMLITGCAGASTPGGATARTGQEPVARKTINAAMMSTPAQLAAGNLFVASAPTYQGGDELQALVNLGLSTNDQAGTQIPGLAEANPTIENGLWKVFPGGQMETTWHLKPNLTWHDGTAVTTADFLFTAELGRTPELPFRDRTAAYVSKLEAPDARTLVVSWNKTYLAADGILQQVRPKHILEKALREDVESFVRVPYWTSEYVGTGAFKVRDWLDGSYVLLDAFDGYAFGRPKIDQITVKFVPDPRAFTAHILANEIDVSLGRNISLAQAMQVKDSWKDGGIEIGYQNWIALFPQMLNPTPAAMAQLPFRQAIIQGIDRQQMMDVLLYGVVPYFAHTWVFPTDPNYKEIEPQVVKYAFDPRRSRQLIEGLGYSLGSDGLYRDPGGQVLALELRTSAGDDTHESALLTAGAHLREVGISTEVTLIPDARRDDRAYQQAFPALRLWRNSNSLTTLDRYLGANAGTPENNFRQTSNYSRYMNPEFDALIERYLTTISVPDRTKLLGQIVHLQSDQLTLMGLFYNTEPGPVSKRLKNVTPPTTAEASHIWNVQDWDVT